jgi:hypothetical protein
MIIKQKKSVSKNVGVFKHDSSCLMDECITVLFLTCYIKFTTKNFKTWRPYIVILLINYGGQDILFGFVNNMEFVKMRENA